MPIFKDAKKECSARKFAELVGVDVKTVTSSIKEGKLKKAIAGTGRLIRINIKKGLKEWEVNGCGLKAMAKQKEAAPTPTDEPKEKEDGTFTYDEKTDIKTVYKVKMLYEAKCKELEFKKKKGTLVEKEQVYKMLFMFGQEIRNSFLALPDRCIDNVLAQPSRNLAHKKMIEEITETLMKLSESEINKKLQKV